MGISDIDRTIIAALDENSRKSYSLLAKEVGLPQETVRYRLNSLLARNAILFFYTVIDPGRLGATIHKLLLKLQNVDEDIVAELTNYFTVHTNVNWVVRLEGAYDIGLTIWVDEIADLYLFTEQLKSRYYRYINKLVFAVNIEAGFISKSLTAEDRQHIAIYSSRKKKSALDALDISILKLLATDPRATFREIASKLNKTPETISMRISSLEQQKIITGYRLVTNSDVLGDLNYYMLIYCNYVSKASYNAFHSYLSQHPLVNYYIRSLGEWGYELNIEAKSREEYREFAMDLTRRFSNIVRSYEALVVRQICKFCILPEGGINANFSFSG